MKKQNLFALALALSIVLAVSGCLGSGQPKGKLASQYPGLIVTNFISDTSSIDAGETMGVEVDFENVGDETATDVQGLLVRKGAFTVDNLQQVAEKNLQSLGAALEPPITDTPSGDAFRWDVKAPAVTQERIEDLQARIFYKYKTQGFATINFVPRDIIREKGIGAFPIDASSSLGPLDIEVVADQPVTLRPNDPLKVQRRLTITITNVGEGRVESNAANLPTACSGSKKGLDCIDKVTIEGLGTSCIDPDKNVPYTETINGLRLVEGLEGKITELINLQVADQGAATSCQIKVTAEYRYRVDSDILPIVIKPVT